MGKLWIAYWPSQWQAATDEETVIDLFFGVFSSKESAVAEIKSGVTKEEWDLYGDEFVYEEVELDRYHQVPHA